MLAICSARLFFTGQSRTVAKSPKKTIQLPNPFLLVAVAGRRPRRERNKRLIQFVFPLLPPSPKCRFPRRQSGSTDVVPETEGVIWDGVRASETAKVAVCFIQSPVPKRKRILDLGCCHATQPIQSPEVQTAGPSQTTSSFPFS